MQFTEDFIRNENLISGTFCSLYVIIISVTLNMTIICFRINITDEDITFWEEKGIYPLLTIDKARDVVRIFVNGHLSGIY